MLIARENRQQKVAPQGERARFRAARGQHFGLYKVVNDIHTKMMYLFNKGKYQLEDFAINTFNSVIKKDHVKGLRSGFANELIAVTSKKPRAISRANKMVVDTKLRVNSREEFTASLKEIARSLETTHNDELLSKIDNVIAMLRKEKNPALDLNIVENAYVSLILQAVLYELKKETGTIFQAEITKQIEVIEHKADVGFTYISSNKLIDHFDDFFKPLFRPGYSRSVAIEGSAGISAGYDVKFARLEATLSAYGIKKEDWFVNDLNYIYIRNITQTGGSFEGLADLGVIAEFDMAGIKFGAKASVSLHASGTKTSGKVYELRDSRAFSTYMLPTLIRDSEHRNDPKISPYLSKSSLLAHTMADYGVTENIFLWAATTRKEVDSIKTLKTKNDLLTKHHDMLQTLLLKKTVNTTPIILPTTTAGVADVTGWAGKVDAGVKAEVAVGTVENALTAGITFKPYSYVDQKARDINYTPLCRRLADVTKPADEKEKIKKQIATEFSLFRDTLMTTWGKDTALIKPKPDLNNEEVLFKFLKEDFDFYSQLQVRLGQGCVVPEDQKLLASFPQRYGADTPEQLLHRMVIFNAYLFSHSTDEKLKASMLKFECAEPGSSQPLTPSLLSPNFEIDEQYMKQHAMYQYEMDFKTIEHQYAGAEYTLGLLGSFNCTFKHEIVEREKIHNESLFDGHNIEYRFSFSGEISNPNALINSITPLIKTDYPELANTLLADMASALSSIEWVGSDIHEKKFVIEYYKPNAFGGKIPMKGLYFRELASEQLQIGGVRKLNGNYIGIPASLKLGAKYTESLTKNKGDVFLTGTFINALRVWVCDYAFGLIDKKSGAIAINSNWNREKQKQKSFFKQNFLRYAAELESNNTESGSLSEQLEAIQNELMKNPNLSTKNKNLSSNALMTFKENVRAFNKDKVRLKYSSAMKSFEEYMHTLYPHFHDRKLNAPYFNEGHVPKLELSKKEVFQANTQKRIGQARLANLFREGDYYVPYVQSDPFIASGHVDIYTI